MLSDKVLGEQACTSKNRSQLLILCEDCQMHCLSRLFHVEMGGLVSWKNMPPPALAHGPNPCHQMPASHLIAGTLAH